MGKTDKDNQEVKIRVDKWLWAARFFKTRGLATEAINGGHVHVNGVRGKPSRPLIVGDELRIQKGQVEMVVIVQALSDKRGPATVAQTLYEETEESKAKREKEAEQRKLLAQSMIKPERRPDKRQRRHIIRFQRKKGGE